MVNTNHQEAVMNTKSTIRKSLAVAAVALAFPAAAVAIPVDDDEPNQPFNPAPIARMTVNPNPAVVSTLPQVAQARAFPGGDVGGAFHDGDLVKFNAGASTDDGSIEKYEFDLDGNGTYEKSGTASSVSRRYFAVGTYAVKLRVTDDLGKTRTIAKNLIVHARPKAALAASPAVALVGQQVNVSAAGSTDDNGIAKYEFDLDGDGTYETNNGLGQAASSSYTTIGDRQVKVRVTDVHGATATRSVKVTVHRAPTAAFTTSPAPAVAGTPVTFDGSGSGDDEPIAKYEWDLDGDGTFETDSAAEPTTTKTFADPATLTVRLRVTDSHGVQDVLAQALTVEPAPVIDGSAIDTLAPLVIITPGKARMTKAGKVTMTLACPAGETQCNGRLSLRTRGARSAALGGKAFKLAGGQVKKVKVQLSKASRKQVRKRGTLRARALAVATDAAGNKGTATRAVKIRR
jgi:PKD repeat protein